jgi:phthiodiolone/phenolphthiodiolone dimycocerosates ketoreductase
MEDHARKVEAAGVADYLWCSDQLVLTIPRALMTPDVLAQAASAGGWDVASDFDPDAWMDPFVSLTVQGSVLERTKVGIAVIDAIRRPPVILAQSLLSLDNMVGGGSFFVLGGGELKQCGPYGITREKPLAHLEDAVRQCKLLWNSHGEPVNYEGKLFNLDRAILALPPVNGVPPQVWVAGASPKTMEIAGRYADGWIMWAPGPCTPDEYAENRDTVRRHAEAAGRDPDELRYGCMFVMMLTENDAQKQAALNDPMMKFNSLIACASASRWAKWGLTHPLGEDWAYMKDFCPQWWTKEETLKAISQVPTEAVERMTMIGTAAELQSGLQAYVDAGCDFAMPVAFASPVGEQAQNNLFRALKAANPGPTGP